MKQMSSKKNKHQQVAMRALKASVKGGLFKDFEKDIKNHHRFIQSIEREIENDQISFSLDAIKKIESTLYTWHYTSGVTFGGVDHSELRDLLLRKDLTPMFREFILKNIGTSLKSFCKIIEYVPRNVIFYGENGYADAYAAEQYSLHLDKFIPVISKIGGKMTSPPIMIAVSPKDIESTSLDEEVLKPWEKEETEEDDLPDISDHPLNQAIDKAMKKACHKMRIEQESADELGWIIILQIDETYREEFSALKSGPYQMFKRISAKTPEPIDFMNNAPGPKKMRIHFFNQIMETILKQATTVSKMSSADNPLFSDPASIPSL